MSIQIVPLPPVSPFSADPVGDAKAALLQVAPGITPTWTYWNDPQTALGQGTGRWQFKGCAYYLPAGASDPIMFTIGCGGIAATSVGGPRYAAAPSFAGMVQSKGPVFPVNMGGERSSTSGALMIVNLSPTNPATVIADIKTIAADYKGAAYQWHYYNDPQTGIGAGTGIWRIQGISTAADGSIALPYDHMVQVSGCALNSVGGAPGNPAPNFSGSGLTPVTTMFPLF